MTTELTFQFFLAVIQSSLWSWRRPMLQKSWIFSACCLSRRVLILPSMNTCVCICIYFACIYWSIYPSIYRVIYLSKYVYLLIYLGTETKDMAHTHTWYDSFMQITWDKFMVWTWFIHVWDVTDSCLGHVPCIGGTWAMHICDRANLYVWFDASVRVTWPIYMCDATHAYSWCIPVFDLTHLFVMCGITWICVWRDPLIFATRHIHMCDVTRSCGTWLHDISAIIPSCAGHGISICVVWDVCDVRSIRVICDHICVTWDPLTCVTCLIHM